MTDVEHGKRLDRILNRLREVSRDRLLAHTIPIYRAVEGGYPVALGSGVLLRIADSSFLLSCAHVVKEAAEEMTTLLTCGEDNELLVDLAGSDYRWTEDEKNEDLAFALLPQRAVDLLPSSKTFLRIADLDLDTCERPGIYSVLGYPLQTTRHDTGAKHVNSSPISFTGYLQRDNLDNYVPRRTVAVSLDHQAIGDVEGNPAKMPHLAGISGCGIWRLGALDGSARPDYSGAATKLVGIEHGIVSNAIIGTHVAGLIDIIREQFPALRTAIDLHL